MKQFHSPASITVSRQIISHLLAIKGHQATRTNATLKIRLTTKSQRDTLWSSYIAGHDHRIARKTFGSVRSGWLFRCGVFNCCFKPLHSWFREFAVCFLLVSTQSDDQTHFTVIYKSTMCSILRGSLTYSVPYYFLLRHRFYRWIFPNADYCRSNSCYVLTSLVLQITFFSVTFVNIVVCAAVVNNNFGPQTSSRPCNCLLRHRLYTCLSQRRHHFRGVFGSFIQVLGG